MDLRARGLDVSAPNSNELDLISESYKTNKRGSEYKVENRSLFYSGDINERLIDNGQGLFELYTDADKADVYWARTDTSVENIESKMSKQPNTSGYMSLEWVSGGGHAIYYTVDSNGKLTLYDAQVNRKETYADISDRVLDCKFIRTDNLTPDYKTLIDKGYIVYD